MCFVTLAGVSAAAGIAGAGISALGAISQGQATGRAAAYQSQVAQNNATIANQNAQYSEEAGAAQAAATSMKGRANLGAIKAAQGANNVDVNTGSASDVQTSERETSNLNTLTAQNNALLEAYGYKSQATGYAATSALENQTAETAPEAGFLAAGGDLLSGASSVGFRFGGGNGGFTGGGSPGSFDTPGGLNPGPT